MATQLPIDLAAIKAARMRIAPYIRTTPLLPFDYLSVHADKEVFLKCEALQRTGSFKIRGATNCILQNLAQAKKCGVVAASAGNHAQGVAAVCHLLGIRSTIVMPVITPPIKIMNTQGWGAEVALVGEVYDESFEYAMKLSQEKGFLFIHPFHDAHVMAGQGTIGLELHEEPVFKQVEAIVIPIGGGGLMTGIATALRGLNSKVKIYGVTAKNSPAMLKSFHQGSPVAENVRFTLAEGVATKRPNQQMLDCLRSVVDEVFALSEESIAHAISLLAEHGKLVAEGAGALSIAAVLENLIPERHIAAVISGGNIDLPALSHVLHRGLVEQGRLARLLITVVDRPGSLLAITQVIAEKQANILQVIHQRNTLRAGIGETEIELDIETKGNSHTKDIVETLQARGFKVDRAR